MAEAAGLPALPASASTTPMVLGGGTTPASGRGRGLRAGWGSAWSLQLLFCLLLAVSGSAEELFWTESGTYGFSQGARWSSASGATGTVPSTNDVATIQHTCSWAPTTLTVTADTSLTALNIVRTGPACASSYQPVTLVINAGITLTVASLSTLQDCYISGGA